MPIHRKNPDSSLPTSNWVPDTANKRDPEPDVDRGHIYFMRTQVVDGVDRATTPTDGKWADEMQRALQEGGLE